MIIKYFKESEGSIWKYVKGSKDYEISRAYIECIIVSCDEGDVSCVQTALHSLRAVPGKRWSTVTESSQSLPCRRTMLTECFLGAKTSNPKPQCHSANRGFFKELFLLTERK